MGLPKVIYIIIPIKYMAEESNEEGLSDGHGINKVFLDLSISIPHAVELIYVLRFILITQW